MLSPVRTPAAASSRHFLALLLIAAGFGPAIAQTPAHTLPPITLAVSAVDSRGTPFPDLTQGDFSITIDGKPAPVAGFRAISAAQAPSYQEVIFVLDGVNLGYQGMAEARLQLSRYLRARAQPALLSSILFVGDTEEKFAAPPTRDGNLLAQELDASESRLRVITRAAGIAGDGERVDTSLRALASLMRLERVQTGRKLVIWISAGWPFLAEPGIEFTSRQQAAQFNYLVRLTNGLREAGITLDTIDPRGALAAMGFQALYYQNFLKGVRRERDMQLGDLSLQVLAVQSGGLVLNSSNDIAAEIAQCLRERSSYYTLDLPAAGPTEQPEYHSIAIHLDKPGLTVHSDAGYYTGPD